MTTSIFSHLERTNDMLEVQMNDINILLPTSREVAIGTQNLNGCTSIVIIGRAIILAHISPRPYARGSAEDHHLQWLRMIKAKLIEHQDLFPPTTTTWGVFGRTEDEPMEHIVELVQGYLQNNGLPTQPAYYDVAPPRTRGLAAGQLVAVARPAGTELYLENRRLENKTEAIPSTSPSIS